jgi:hypothetical protein
LVPAALSLALLAPLACVFGLEDRGRLVDRPVLAVTFVLVLFGGVGIAILVVGTGGASLVAYATLALAWPLLARVKPLLILAALLAPVALGASLMSGVMLIACLGSAAVLCGQMRPQHAPALLVCAFLLDFTLWRTGELSRLFAGSVSPGLSGSGFLEIGGWRIGTGDLMCCAILGAWLRATEASRVRWTLTLALLTGGMFGAVEWASGQGSPIPATTPIVATLAVSAVVMKVEYSVRKRRNSPVAAGSPRTLAS